MNMLQQPSRDTLAMNARALLAGAGLAALLYGGPAHGANAANILWNQANPGGFESATGADGAFRAASSLGGISISFSNVNREVTPNGITENNVNIINTTGATQVLRIIAGANGFFGPSVDFGLSATILTALGTSELTGSFYAVADNALNGTTFSVDGVDIGDFDSGLLNGPHSFSFNGSGADALFNTYGLAESLTLTLQPFAQIGVQSISMDASAVPEPKTWALMGVGFGLMALMGWKRRKGDRLAVSF